MASPIPDEPPVISADFIRASLGIGADCRVVVGARYVSPLREPPGRPQEERPPRGRRPLRQGREEKRMDLRSGSSPRAGEFLRRTVRGVEPVALTSLARAGGCAAKYAAGRLETLLAGLVPADSDDLLVGLDPADDAAVYRLDDERAIVFTVDFFPPLVDDPRTFGAIAATNALNDVFAMGGASAPRALGRCVPRGASGRGARRGPGGRGRARSSGGGDPRGRSHDSRRRAEVRPRRGRHGASAALLAQGGGEARRRAPSDEAARDRNRSPGAARRRRSRRRARSGRRVDARAEHGCRQTCFGRSSRTR